MLVTAPSLPPQDALVAHRDHERRPSGSQPRPEGSPSTLMTSSRAVGVDRDHALVVEVGEPEAAIVPARALEETSP